MCENNENDKKENARIVYQAAINLMIGENQLYWSKFNSFIVVNSIIILATAAAMAPLPKYKMLLVISAGIIGFILNGLGLLMLIRSFYFHQHWRKSAREIEETVFEGTGIISRSEKFSANEKVSFNLAENKELQISHWGRCDLKRFGAQLIIFLITITYLFSIPVSVIINILK